MAEGLTSAEKQIRRDVMKTAGPVLIEVLLSSLFGMVDMVMVGRIPDKVESAASIAAIGLTNQVVFIAVSLIQALNVGATAMVARYIGANKADRIENVVRHVVLLTQLIIAIPVIILGLSFSEEFMRLLGAEQDTIMYGTNYFKIIVLGLLFQSFNLSIYAVLRGAGDTKTPMSINLRANFLNVIGNAILIYGLIGAPRLGVTGAGVSTSLSQLIGSIMIVTRVLKHRTIIRINFKERFKFNKDIVYNLVKIGVPASLEQIAFRVGILLFIRIVATLGTVAYATHQIGLNILNFSFTPGQAFGIAASSLVGRSLGAEERDKAEKYIKECRRIGSVISTGVGVVFFFFGSFIASLYTTDPVIIHEAGNILKVAAVVQPFQSSQLVVAGGLRGAGDTVWTLIAIFVSVLIIRVVLAYLFINVIGTGLIGAWYAIFIDQIVRWLLISIRFRTGKWKYIHIR
ncbi:MAG TPA: MATE family efflux transporter [Tissierellia bacterium]|nr:MATE family efflux transporter [Tissierellia bacterium]